MTATFQKLILSLLFITAALLIYTKQSDTLGLELLDDSLKEAAAVFATAKLLNGVISVIQESGIDFGVMLSVGQILDPINDLVEQFSDVMLLALVSLGIQRLLIEVFAFDTISVALIALTVPAVLFLWIKSETLAAFGNGFIKFLLVVLIIKFLTPAFVLTNHYVATEILDKNPRYNIEDLNKNLQTQEDKWATIRQDSDKESSWFDFSKQYDVLKEKVSLLSEQTSRYIEQTIVVFVFKTILFPLLFLAVVYFLSKNLLRMLDRFVFSEEIVD